MDQKEELGQWPMMVQPKAARVMGRNKAKAKFRGNLDVASKRLAWAEDLREVRRITTRKSRLKENW